MPVEVLRLVAASGLLLAAVALAATPDVASGGTPRKRPAAHATDADRAVFERVLLAMRSRDGQPTGELVVAAGLALEGTPYVAGALEMPGPERLVCNLRGLDCVTFVEASVAMARVARAPQPSFEAFLDELAGLRYRDGEPRGYASRLHYFSEWIRRNGERGVVRDVTRDLGGSDVPLLVSYMSTHRKLYPRLAHEPTFQAIRRVESELSGRRIAVIPRERLAEASRKLADGDILAFVPTTEGLDVSHTGLVYRSPGGAPHLLHAPDVGERVRVNPETLAEYVERHPKVAGLVVARPR